MRTGGHLGRSGQEVAGRLLEGAQEGAAQGPHGGEALHVLVGQDGLPLLLALGQCHVQWLGPHDAPVHLCHGLRRLFWRGKTHKAKPFAVATLCHHLKARQDKGCWGWRRKTPGATLPTPWGAQPSTEGTQEKLRLRGGPLSPTHLLRPTVCQMPSSDEWIRRCDTPSYSTGAAT